MNIENSFNEENGNSAKHLLAVVINSPQSLLDFLKTKSCSEFTTKNMAIWLKDDFNLPKIKTTKLIQELKVLGVIERRSESSICKTICASCYEYGCDAELTPPINYWKILRWSI